MARRSVLRTAPSPIDALSTRPSKPASRIIIKAVPGVFLTSIPSFCVIMIIGVRDHFRIYFYFYLFFLYFFLGGQHVLYGFCTLARKIAYVWVMHFCRTYHWGGGRFGRGEYYSFEVIVYRKQRRGRVCEDFLDGFWGIKTGFWWVIRLKLTSTLAPNVYNDCSIRGPFYLLSDVLDSKGEAVSKIRAKSI